MKNPYRLSLLLGIIIYTSVACQSQSEDTEKQAQQDHVFSPQVKALRQAQSVQSVMDKHEQQNRQKIQDALE